MNWGTRITILYTGFVAFMVCMVIMSMKQKSELVASDYYARELAYQELMNKAARSQAFSDPLLMEQKKEKLSLHFPKELSRHAIMGTVELYRASDASKDRKFSFSTSNGEKQISLEGVTEGHYTLKVEWQTEGLTYYDERLISVK